MKQLEYNTIIDPRRGSDYAFCVARERAAGPVAICGVLDTMGDVRIKNTRGFFRGLEQRCADLVRDERIADLPALVDRLRAEIVQRNGEIGPAYEDGEETVFGFCLAFAALFANRVSVLWLGDCRAYLLRRVSTDPSTNATRPWVFSLTKDHNQLHALLEKEKEYTFLKNELSDLSRRLTCFWGMQDEHLLKDVLNHPHEPTALRPDDTLLLMTDGLYLPIVRYTMELRNFRLTADEYSLRYWLQQFLTDGRFGQDEGHDWPELLDGLKRACFRVISRKPRYRDDIAAVMLHLR